MMPRGSSAVRGGRRSRQSGCRCSITRMNDELLRRALVHLTVEFGLRELRAMTDHGIVTVSEPGIWEDPPESDYGLKVEEREVSP